MKWLSDFNQRYAGWIIVLVGVGATATLFALGYELVATISLVLAVASLLVSVRTARPPGGRDLDGATEALGRMVLDRLRSERRELAIRGQDLVPLRWRSRADFKPRQGPGAAVPDEGGLDTLIEQLDSLSLRVVVLGDSGTGKTSMAVLLAFGLLLRRQPNQPIPVVLSLGTWNPDTDLLAWIGRSLAEAYPGLVGAYGAGIYEELAQHRVMPVLDGFDSLPPAARVDSMQRILQTPVAGERLVLTCRRGAFEELDERLPLPALTAIELLPLDVAAVADLLADSPGRMNRWGEVYRELVSNPDCALAVTLTRPLMLFLARTAYAPGRMEPAELLDKANAGDRAEVERHLLEVYVQDTCQSYRRSSKPDKVRSWLENLAQLGDNLAWWKFRDEVPPAIAVAAGMLLGVVTCGAMGSLFFGLFGLGEFGLLFGLASGGLGGLLFGLTPPKEPRRFTSRIFRRSALRNEPALKKDLIIWTLSGALIVNVLTGRFDLGLATAAINGAAGWWIHRSVETIQLDRALSPQSLLDSDRKAVLYAGAIGAIDGAIIGAWLTGYVGALEHRFVTSGGIMAYLIGAGIFGMLGIFGYGIVQYATSSWAKSITSQLWLWQRRRLPLRLMRFLRDAHQLGILRQVGAYYQFRHAELQDHLKPDR